jgi:hypothetical protein
VAALGPLIITARTRAQAEYLIRSRAEQRGVRIVAVTVGESGPDTWSVTVDVDENDIEKLAVAALDQDTQVLHFRNHPHRRG